MILFILYGDIFEHFACRWVQRSRRCVRTARLLPVQLIWSLPTATVSMANQLHKEMCNVLPKYQTKNTNSEQVLSVAGTYGHIKLFSTVMPLSRSTERLSSARRAPTVGGSGMANMAAAARRCTGLVSQLVKVNLTDMRDFRDVMKGFWKFMLNR